jgi:hypothetical protein
LSLSFCNELYPFVSQKNLVNYIELEKKVPPIKNKNPEPEALFKIWDATTLLIMA